MTPRFMAVCAVWATGCLERRADTLRHGWGSRRPARMDRITAVRRVPAAVRRRLRGARGGDGVGDDGQPRVGGDLQGVVVEVADRGVMEELPSTAVVVDVVCVPPQGELGALGGEFVDQVGEFGVVRGAGGLGAQAADGVVDDARPVAVEAPGARVEEDEGRRRRSAGLGPAGCCRARARFRRRVRRHGEGRPRRGRERPGERARRRRAGAPRRDCRGPPGRHRPRCRVPGACSTRRWSRRAGRPPSAAVRRPGAARRSRARPPAVG